MNNDSLWAPWRMAYLRDLKRRAEAAGETELAARPFLSEYFADPDADVENHVVCRNEHGLIVLNRYPYAAGHLLVALGEARPTLLDYEPAQRLELWKLLETGTALLERVLRPQGINMGINQGRAAGAGLPDHLHAHLVPRWHADTNFLSVVGSVRLIPDSLAEMTRQLRDAAAELGR